MNKRAPEQQQLQKQITDIALNSKYNPEQMRLSDVIVQLSQIFDTYGDLPVEHDVLGENGQVPMITIERYGMRNIWVQISGNGTEFEYPRDN